MVAVVVREVAEAMEVVMDMAHSCQGSARRSLSDTARLGILHTHNSISR